MTEQPFGETPRSKAQSAIKAMVELYNAVGDTFKEHLPCEVQGHGSVPGHTGIGEWYVTHTCPECAAVDVVLSCSGFVQMMNNNINCTVPCVDCGEYTTIGELITDLTAR